MPCAGPWTTAERVLAGVVMASAERPVANYALTEPNMGEMRYIGLVVQEFL